MSCLKVSNLSYSIADKTLLRNISFTVEQGETIAIVGPNGAGKTTLLKLILSIYKAPRGSVTLFDKDSISLSGVERARLTSYVPQREETAPSFTVAEFVEMSLYSQGMRFNATPETHRKVSDALENVGMSEFSRRLVPTLSGGEWQKIQLAGLLAQESALALLDEPTAFLDPHYQVEVAVILRKLAQAPQKATMVVTHDLNLAVAVASKIIALKNGELIFSGGADEFVDESLLRNIYGITFAITRNSKSGATLINPPLV